MVALLAGAVGLAWIALSGDRRRPSAPRAGVAGQSRKPLLSALQANFDLATQGGDPQRSRMTVVPRDNDAGLVWDPTVLHGETAAIRMVLPGKHADRKGVLAVLVPDGSMRTIYISYGIDTDPEDLIIPSRAINWESARTRNHFVVTAGKFDALPPGKDSPEPLFQQPGVYQFALINTNDRSLLEYDRTPFRVLAGCVVHWQP